MKEGQTVVVVCARTGAGYLHNEVPGKDTTCKACGHLIRLCDSTVESIAANAVAENDCVYLCQECAKETMQDVDASKLEIMPATDRQLREVFKTDPMLWLQMMFATSGNDPEKFKQIVKGWMKDR